VRELVRHLKRCLNFKTMHPEKYNEFFGSGEIINLNGRDFEQGNAIFFY